MRFDPVLQDGAWRGEIGSMNNHKNVLLYTKSAFPVNQFGAYTAIPQLGPFCVPREILQAFAGCGLKEERREE
jgi:hypothetical protein